MRPARRIRHEEDGAVLVMALILVTAIALVTGALLTKGQGNFKATVQLRAVAGSAYSADSAAKAAIGVLQQGEDADNLNPGATYPSVGSGSWVYDNYADGTGCFGYKATDTAKTSLELNNFYPATGSVTAASSVRVECSPVAGTGRLGSGQGVPITGQNTPGRALTLLGTGGTTGDGLQLKPLGSGNDNRFVVAGGVASNAAISVSNGALFSNTYVWGTSCSGTIVSPSKDCAHATVANPGASWTPDFATIGSYPFRSGPTSTCTFSPGYYDDAAALSGWTDACTTSTFQPGKYYFDFHNNPADPMYNADAMSSSGESVWNINKTVIGGVATGGSTSPGRCDSPIEKANAQGVQFVFGGDSHIALGANAVVELCGTSSSTSPPIALFGLNSGGNASLVSPAATTAGTVDTSGSTPTWNANTATPARLATVDGTSATWVSPNTGSPTGKLTLTGFTTSIPAGSTLASAQLQVTHSETITSGTVAKPTVRIDAGSLNQTFTPNARPTLGTDTFDVKAVLSDAVQQGTLGTAVPTVTLTETGKNTTFNVDAVRLVLTYYPPSMRAQTNAGFGATNCVATGSCSFLDTKNNWGGTFVVNGVTYLPNGAVAIDPGNGGGLVAFRYGLVARGLNMKGQPRYTFGYPVVSLPDQGPGFGSNVTAVDLKVYVCVGQGTCASGGTLTLTSRVKITDPAAPAQPAPLTRKIEILSWSEQR